MGWIRKQCASEELEVLDQLCGRLAAIAAEISKALAIIQPEAVLLNHNSGARDQRAGARRQVFVEFHRTRWR